MRPPEKPTPRQILSANLKTLMSSRPALGTIKKVALASGSTLSNGKVGRIYKASHTTDIDTLQHLATVFGLQPWQLLVEGLKADSLPILIDQSVIDGLRQAVSHPTAPAQGFFEQAEQAGSRKTLGKSPKKKNA